MKKMSLLALALTATVALGACSSEEEPSEDTSAAQGDGAEPSGDDAMGSGDAAGETGAAATYADPSCQEFFTEGGPLADRADAAREAISNGEIVDMATYGEVNLLKQRIDETTGTAPEDIGALLEQVNAPFAETVAAVNEGKVIDESGAITLPKIDVQASADAQAELETACAG